MWEFSLLKATQAIEKTFAYTVHRLLVSLGIGFAYIGALLFGAGIGFAIGGRIGSAGFAAEVGALFGLTFFGWLMFWYRKKLNFTVKGGSVALFVELMESRAVPNGRKQINHAKAIVEKRFGKAAVLFDLDQKIDGVLHSLTRKYTAWGQRLPVLSNVWITRIIDGLLSLPLAYSHGAVIAFCIKNKSDPFWRSAQQATILYAQNFNKIVKNSLWLNVLVATAWLAVFILVWIPVGWAFELLPNSISIFWQAVFTLILSWIVKAAYFDPIALGSMIQLFFKTIDGQTVDSDWEKKLDSDSPDYREIKGRASK